VNAEALSGCGQLQGPREKQQGEPEQPIPCNYNKLQPSRNFPTLNHISYLGKLSSQPVVHPLRKNPSISSEEIRVNDF
jgi:hypothetical protein